MIFIKTITIKEPFATLIKDGIKTVETRSWKTNYRGELYIHSGLSRSTSENVAKAEKLLKTEENPGYILCKCELIDCEVMTPEYIDNIKKNTKEYTCGRYAEGRYGWKLRVIEILDPPIKCKGKLGLWNYDDKENK